MAHEYNDVESVLAMLDPARMADRQPDMAHRRTVRDGIMAMPQRPQPQQRTALRIGGRRLMWTVVGTASVALMFSALTTTGRSLQTNRSAFAVTPKPLAYSAPEQGATVVARLEAIARRTAAQGPAEVSGQGRHLVWRSWSLTTRIDGQQVTSVVIPEHIELWLNADFSGKQVKEFEPPVFSSQAERRQWEEAGSPAPDAASSRTSYGPGDYRPYWRQPVPSDPEQLDQALSVGHPQVNGPAERFVAIEDLYREQVLGPQQRAGVLRFLARTPELQYRGQVMDRAGRKGEAFSIDSGYSGLMTRYTLIVDPGAGHILGSEEMLTDDAGRLNVRVPSVISYTSYLKAEVLLNP